MAIERTLSILKPDATTRNITGKINAIFEENGFRIIAQRRVLLTRSETERFYIIHKERPFYKDLCDFMSSAPVVVQVLEGENAILKNRAIMGATNPEEAAPGTIRALFGLSIDQNTVHGSDSAATAAQEIAFFFKETDIVG
ncbi:MAG: nucleoside-diphosphate kinase [Holosporales bacterium]|jgi:nucleoside-diphosphate kinase|nr:nucleoside-diphosphate kinase [Holosporales bacterium]